MAKALAIVALTVGTASIVPLGVNPDQLQAVRITNESPYALQVTTPDSDIYWLAAWCEDMLLVTGAGNVLTILPQMLPGVPPQSAQSTAALITIYLKGEKVPQGNWPVPLARQTNNGNILNLNTSATFQPDHKDFTAGNKGNVFVTIAQAGQTAYLTGFIVSGAPGAALLSLNYDFSGINATANPDFWVVSTTAQGFFQSVTFPQAIPATGPNVQIGLRLLTNANANCSSIIFGYSV